MREEPKWNTTVFWVLIIGILIAIGVFFVWDTTTTSSQQTTAPAEPTAEWTTAPEGGVPVDLPETPLGVEPIDAQAVEPVEPPPAE